MNNHFASALRFAKGLLLIILITSMIIACAPLSKDTASNLLLHRNSAKLDVSTSGNSVAAETPTPIIGIGKNGKSGDPNGINPETGHQNKSKPKIPLPKGTSQDWWQKVQRGIAESEYHPSDSQYGLQAPNRAHNLRTYFTTTGIKLHDRTAAGNPKLAALSLSKIGRGKNLEPVPAGSVNRSEKRVEIRRPGVIEWYENTAKGLEQGFTLSERKQGQGSLILELAVEHAKATLRGQSIELATDAGRRLRYGKLIAQDADGKTLASHMEVPSPRKIRLVVDDIDAAYPLVIDPLVTGVEDALLESNDVWSGSFDSAMFGYSVSGAGDVNGDGFSDVAIGAYGWDAPGGLFDEGAAFVFLGGQNGMQGTDPTTANAMLLGDQVGAEFGNSVAGAGDVNGDGFDDIVVAAHHYESTIAGGTLAVDGAVFVFLGGPAGIVGSGPSTADAAIFGNQIDCRLGHVVAGAGDVNGDGFADIIIGAPLEGIPFPPNIPPNQGSGNGGAALVFHGGPAGIVGTGFDNADRVILPYPPGQPVASLGQLGAGAAAAGDVNGDGFADVLVGSGDGYALIFHGSAAGIVGTDPGTANAKISNSALVSLSGIVSGAGDVNGDGFDDILLSDPGFPTGITSGGHGAFMVFHGSASGITATSPADANTFIEGDLPIVVLGPVQSLGWRLSGAGDIDGDGFGDIIIGALDFPGSFDLEGAAYVFKGSAAGIVGSSLADAYVHLKTGQAGAAVRGNKPGFDVAGVGDVNGDGFADVLVGAALYDNGQTDEGAALVFHGGSNGSPSPIPIINSLSAIPGATSGDFVLIWTTTNATGASIDNGVGAVAVDGSVTVSPAATTTYTLTATGAGGTATSSVTVTVTPPPPGPPTVDSFLATPTSITAGGSATLSWTTTGADSVSIDNGVGTGLAANGSIGITPATTMTYTLTTVPGGAGSSIIVTVNAGPPPTITTTFTGFLDKGETITHNLAIDALGTVLFNLTWDDARADPFLTVSDPNNNAVDSIGGAPPIQGSFTATITGLYFFQIQNLNNKRKSNYVLQITHPTGGTPPPPPTLSSISVAPSIASIEEGQTQLFTATGTFSDGSTSNLTTTAAWTSSTTTVATIDAFGLASGVAAGTTNISASQDGMTSNVATLTVTAALPPPTPQGTVTITGPTTINRGDNVSYTLIVSNSGSSTLTGTQLTIIVNPSDLLKNISPGSSITIGDIFPGESASQILTARGDREGSGTVIVGASIGGNIFGTATYTFTVIK